MTADVAVIPGVEAFAVEEASAVAAGVAVIPGVRDEEFVVTAGVAAVP